MYEKKQVDLFKFCIFFKILLFSVAVAESSNLMFSSNPDFYGPSTDLLTNFSNRTAPAILLTF